MSFFHTNNLKGQKPLFSHYQKRLFLGVYIGFFLFAICVVWQILWSGASLRSIQGSAFLDNEAGMRRLESQVQRRLDRLKQKFLTLCQINSNEELQYFRTHYPELNLKILSEELPDKDYQHCLSGEKPFPGMVIAYRLPEVYFTQLANSIKLFFAGEKHIPVMRERLLELEGELYEQIAALNIQPLIDHERQMIEFDYSDMENLAALSMPTMSYRPLFLQHEKMELEANYKFFGFNIDFFELWPPQNESLAFFQPPPNEAGLLQWLMQLALRSEGRFGQAPVVYIDNSDEKPVYRVDPRLDYAQQIFPDRKNSQGNFFAMRTENNSVSYIWSLYPQTYGIYEHEKNQKRLGLLPEQVLVGYVGDLNLCRIYAADIINNNMSGFGFGLQIRYGADNNFAHGFKNSQLDDFFSTVTLDSVRSFSSVSGFLSLSEAPEWVTAYFNSSGQNLQSLNPFDFSWHNPAGEEFYASLRISSLLGGAHVLIYQPAWRFLKPYYLQWLAVLLLFLLTIPIYFYIQNTYISRVSASISSCLADIEKDEENNAPPRELHDEMDLLRASMSDFKRTIKETMFHFDLHSGFQKILNEPHLTFVEYAQRFVNFSQTLPAEYRFYLSGLNLNAPGLPPNSPSSADSYYLPLEPNQEELSLLCHKLHIKDEIIAVFPYRQTELSGTEQVIFRKYFRNLLASSLLEEQYLQAQNLKKDMELSEQMRAALSPNQDLSIPNLQVSWRTFRANTLNGNFYDVLPQNDSCHFYLVRVLQEGIGAGLIACYLKSFLIASSEYISSPTEIIKDLYASHSADIQILYGILNMTSRQLSFAVSGDFGLILTDKTKVNCRHNHNYPSDTIQHLVFSDSLVEQQIILPSNYRLMLYSSELYPTQIFGSSKADEQLLVDLFVRKNKQEDFWMNLQNTLKEQTYTPKLDGMALILETTNEKPTL